MTPSGLPSSYSALGQTNPVTSAASRMSPSISFTIFVSLPRMLLSSFMSKGLLYAWVSEVSPDPPALGWEQRLQVCVSMISVSEPRVQAHPHSCACPCMYVCGCACTFWEHLFWMDFGHGAVLISPLSRYWIWPLLTH